MSASKTSEAKEVIGISPFNLYDFFGYIFPAIFFIGSMFYIFNETIFSELAKYKTVYESNKFLLSFFTITIFIVIVYVIGHALATISHIIIDRLVVGGIIGYPINRLLQFESKKTRPFSSWSYALILLLIMIMLFIPTSFIINKHFQSNNLEFAAFITEKTSILRFVIKCFCWTIFLLVLSRILQTLIKFWADEKGEDLKFFKEERNKIGELIGYFYDKTIGVLIRITERLLNTDRNFNKEFCDKFKIHFKKRFDLDPENAGTENYWLSYYEAVSKEAAFSKLIINWLHLYSFARNMSCTCFIICSIILHQILFSEDLSKGLFVFYSINYFLGVLFFLRYWALYASYYTKAVVRAFYVLESSKN